jgi:hypothetical protein
LIPNEGWTYQKLDHAIEQWKQEGRIVELEPGKFKPVMEEEN